MKPAEADSLTPLPVDPACLSSLQKPEGWLDEEPAEVDDPEATKPEDWDDEEDGEWEPPRVSNPKCKDAPGCGEWVRPSKRNPEYKGKWSAPLIDNPEYKGVWKVGGWVGRAGRVLRLVGPRGQGCNGSRQLVGGCGCIGACCLVGSQADRVGAESWQVMQMRRDASMCLASGTLRWRIFGSDSL